MERIIFKLQRQSFLIAANEQVHNYLLAPAETGVHFELKQNN